MNSKYKLNLPLTDSGTGKYEKLLERCRGLAPIRTAVAYPCEETALAGAIDAGRQGLILPILVGPSGTIATIATAKGFDLGGAEMVDVADSRASAAKAVLVLGARVPIILTSRADSLRSRIASCAVAVLAAHTRRQMAR